MNIYFLILYQVFSTQSYQLPWVEMRDLQDRFTVSFPKAPDYKHQDITTELGKVQNESFYVQGIKEHPNDIYLFNILSYSYELAEVNDDEVVEEVLQNAVLDLAEKNEMKPSYVVIKRDEDNGNPYADVRYINANKSKVMRARLFLYRYNMVVMQVYMSEKESMNDKIDYFFRSYKNLM